jgi:hypothetical protein
MDVIFHKSANSVYKRARQIHPRKFSVRSIKKIETHNLNKIFNQSNQLIKVILCFCKIIYVNIKFCYVLILYE